MKLHLQRKWFNDKRTIGELFIDEEFVCFTLEDRIRGPHAPKVYGETAIPAGTYPVAITFSNRFKRPLPLLFNVPGYEGIRIHPGNTEKDTEGCLLVGTSRVDCERIENSRAAFNTVFGRLLAVNAHERIEILIENVNPPPELLAA